MISEITTENEAARLAALGKYNILDTASDRFFDDLTEIAAQICSTPIAAISLVDKNRQWFKSSIGISVSETARAFGFCPYAIAGDELFIIQNAAEDERFAENPFVAGEPHIRFYAGAPLITKTGESLGTLCVVDYVARELSERQKEALRALGRQAMSQLELRLEISEKMRTEALLRESEHRYRQLVSLFPDAVIVHSEGELVYVNPAAVQLLGATDRRQLIGCPVINFVHPDDKPFVAERIGQVSRGDYVPPVEEQFVRLDGTTVEVEVTGIPLTFNGKPAVQAIAHDITRRRRIENEKAQLAAQGESSRHRLKSIIANVPGVVWELWSDASKAAGLVDFVSDYVEVMLGYTAEEWLTTPDFWLSVVHPEDHDIAREQAIANFSGREGAVYEFRMIARDRRVVWTQVQATTVFGDDNNPIGVRGITLDISEAKAIRESLESNAERLQKQNKALTHLTGRRDLFLEAFADALREITETTAQTLHAERVGIWFYNDDRSRIQTIDLYESNESARANRFELTAAECPSYFEALVEESIIAADDAATDDRTAELAKSYLAPLNIVSKLDVPIRVDGTTVGVVCIEHTGAARDWKLDEQNFAGSISGLVSLLLETSERRQVEEALRQSQQQFRSLIGSIEGIVWEMDAQTFNFTFVSEQAERLLGYPADQWIAEPDFWVNHLHPDDREQAVRFCLESTVRRENHEFEYRMIAADRRVVWLRDYVTVDTGFAEPQRLRGVMVEVTKTKELEDRLRQAQKLESVGRLAGGIAHDFNNMLTAISGYSTLTLRRLTDGDPLRHNIEEIKKAADRSAELTYQLLAFSRQQILQPRVVNLNQIIIDTGNMLERLIGEDIDLVTILNTKAAPVEVDPGQITQVIMNLVVNARDAMPQGGRLTIETANVFLEPDYANQDTGAAHGAYVMLTVRDNGIGMSSQTQNHLFEPFFTTKAVGQGTGLGLASVYGIVKQSGGNIEVESSEGVGTTFKVYLPRAPQQPEAEQAAGNDFDLKRGSETILLVEDEEMVRHLSRDILNECGYTVLEAVNGIEALEICERENCNLDLLMTDVVMPGMGGRELAHVLKAKLPDLKILYTSGYTDDAVVRHGIIETSTNFIQKPFAPEDLAKKLREVLDNTN